MACHGEKGPGGAEVSAAEAWRIFAKDHEGAALAHDFHERLKARGVWVWKDGAIEDVLETSKREKGWITKLEQDLAVMEPTVFRSKYPAVGEFLNWVRSGV